MSFSNGQSKLAGEILGNIGIAWITGGVISPVFLSYPSQLLLLSAIMGTLIGGGFIYFGLYLVKDID